MTGIDDDHVTLGLGGPAAGINSLLFNELNEMIEPSDYQLVNSGRATDELSIDEIHQILGLSSAASTLLNMTQPEIVQPAVRRERNESLGSQNTGSPESGISGCDGADSTMSPSNHDFGKSPSPYDPIRASMEQAHIIPTTDDMMMGNFLDMTAASGMSDLLQLAEESHQLTMSSNAELEQLVQLQRSPLIRDTNPVLGQARSPVMPYTGGPAPRPYDRLPYAVPGRTTASVIVRSAPSGQGAAPLAHPGQGAFSIPGSLTFSQTQIKEMPEFDDSDKGGLPVTVTDFAGEEKAELVQPKQEVGPDGQYMCYVCGEKAGKHSYYGGQVCASCRAFFRRSVQSKYWEIFECKKEQNCVVNAQTRKSCQFCRFTKCIRSGMKQSWVLSDDERNRRFNKFNKINMKSVNNEKPPARMIAPYTRIPEIYMPFTHEEQKVLENIQSKFQGQYCTSIWLKNLLMLNRDAGINLIQSSFRVEPIKYETWTWLIQSWSLAFSQNVLPHFTKGHSIPSREFSQLINGSNLYVAHTFKSSMCIQFNNLMQQKTEGACQMTLQVKELAKNKDDVEMLDLTPMLERLDLKNSAMPPALPTYHELYPSHWANDPDVERKHFNLITKIKNWPKYEDNEFDCNMVMMMMLIMFFDTTNNPLAASKTVEAIQLKYSMLLQRYLRSKMAGELANIKFLQAMLLLSETRELCEMNQQYARM